MFCSNVLKCDDLRNLSQSNEISAAKNNNNSRLIILMKGLPELAYVPVPTWEHYTNTRNKLCIVLDYVKMLIYISFNDSEGSDINIAQLYYTAIGAKFMLSYGHACFMVDIG